MNKATGKLIRMGVVEVNEGSDYKSIVVDVSSAAALESLPPLQPSGDKVNGGRETMTMSGQQRPGPAA
jgi:hypothetical protein